MIYEIQTIRRIRPNLEYLFTVHRLIPEKVTRCTERKIDKKQVDEMIREGGFQKVEITSTSGNYTVFQKHIETPELRDIAECMTKEMIKDKTYFIIKGSDKLFKISEVQGRLHVSELHKAGPIYATHLFYVHSVTDHHVTFISMGEKEQTTYNMLSIFKVDKTRLSLVEEWNFN